MKKLDQEILEIDERYELDMHPCEHYLHVGEIYDHYVGTVWHWNYGDAPNVYYTQKCPFCSQVDCSYIYYFKKNYFSTSKCEKYGGAISFIMAFNKISVQEAMKKIEKMMNGDIDW